MRLALVVVGLALAVAGGCSAEKERVAKEQKFTAARLDGKFDQRDPIVMMLSPGERDALREAGMLSDTDPIDGDLAAQDGAEGGEATLPDGTEPESTSDKVSATMMSVLTVSMTLGMMVAPYLLF